MTVRPVHRIAWAALVIAGCQSASDASRESSTSSTSETSGVGVREDVAGGEPTPSPTPTPEPTPSPTTAAAADVVVTAQALLVPPEDPVSLVGFQVVATIQNRGEGWAKLDAFASDWTVLDTGGGVTATGRFQQAFPQYLEPGATGYLVAHDVPQGLTSDLFASLEVSPPEVEDVDGPAVTFEFENTQVRYDVLYGLIGTGFVIASEDRELPAVGVICLDANGNVLGAVTAPLIDGMTAGEPQAFETSGPPTQVQPNSCASAVFEGNANDF